MFPDGLSSAIRAPVWVGGRLLRRQARRLRRKLSTGVSSFSLTF
jgi:hypothetical protein